MKKTQLLSTLVIALSFLLATAHSALALEIIAAPNGSVSFYEDSVLGKQTDNGSGQGNGGGTAAQAPIKTVSPRSGQQINITPMDDELQVGVQQPNVRGQGFQDTDVMRVNRLDMQVPAAGNPTQQKAAEKRNEAGQMNGETVQDRSEYREMLMEQRQERQEEMIQIRNQLKENKQSLNIESRGVKANLNQGAEFSYDAETNQIILTTPSGETHVLNHLPDQAVARLIELGLDTNDSELNVLTKGDDVLYTATGSRRKKFLGLFNRNVPTEIELNDETGEAMETELPADSFIDGLLNSLSF